MTETVETNVVEAEVIGKVKTEADLALDAVDKAKEALLHAQHEAGQIAEKLIADWKHRKEQLESEMKKLGVLVVQDAEIIEEKVSQAIIVAETQVQSKVAKHPVVAVVVPFVVAFILGFLVSWKVR